MKRFDGYQIVSDRRLGEGGFLRLRRLTLRVRGEGGWLSDEGTYDFVERPNRPDAVVLALYHRAPSGVQVLLRAAPRVPVWFADPAAGQAVTELVAGILEVGEEDWPAIVARAVAEAYEEAGIALDAAEVVRLGAPLYPTPGMCAERFHFVAAEVRHPSAAATPPTDGSPFELGASLEWLPLDAALGRCQQGQIVDLKTELGLRRLREQLDRG